MKKGISIGILWFWMQLLTICSIADAAGKYGTLSGGSGHDVPTPFSLPNQKFELADGEVYALPGREEEMAPAVLGQSGAPQPFFAVDLSQYSALTNPFQQGFRYYPLEIAPENESKWHGFSGTLLCRAHGRIVSDGIGDAQYVIYLEPISKN